jgi:hypothetical protein
MKPPPPDNTRRKDVSPEPESLRRHGLEHPNERFEFARFCLLKWYERDPKSMEELNRFASCHRETLDAVAAQPACRGPDALADYRIAWGLLSFLARDPVSGVAEHPLKTSIDRYRSRLQAFLRKCGLAASWCAPSIHLALLAPRAFPGNFEDPGRVRTLYPLFVWDPKRQGDPPYDTVLSQERLLILSDSPGRRVDATLLSCGDETIYYDPRMDRWSDCLDRVRRLLGKRRLSSASVRELLERRRRIESAFAADGYPDRRKPRRLRGQHALARWTYWTYLAICPLRKTTAEILAMIGRADRDTQQVDQAIKHVLDLLQFSSRSRRSTV